MQTDDGPKPEDRIDEDEVVRRWKLMGGAPIIVESLEDAFIVINILKRRLDESACSLFFGYASGGVAIYRIK